MYTPELMAASMQEKDREVAELLRQHEAVELQRGPATRRKATPEHRNRRLPIVTFVARKLRMASVS